MAYGFEALFRRLFQLTDELRYCDKKLEPIKLLTKFGRYLLLRRFSYRKIRKLLTTQLTQTSDAVLSAQVSAQRLPI